MPARAAWGSAIPSNDELGRVALEIIDEAGLDALTLRELGRRLGASHGNLYRLFANREELLDLVCTRVLADAALEGIEASGADWLRECAWRLKEAWLAHPHACPLLMTKRETLLAAFDLVAQRFEQLVPDTRERALAFHGYSVFLIGWLLVYGSDIVASAAEPAMPVGHASLMRVQTSLDELAETGEELTDESFRRALESVIPKRRRK